MFRGWRSGRRSERFVHWHRRSRWRLVLSRAVSTPEWIQIANSKAMLVCCLTAMTGTRRKADMVAILRLPESWSCRVARRWPRGRLIGVTGHDCDSRESGLLPKSPGQTRYTGPLSNREMRPASGERRSAVMVVVMMMVVVNSILRACKGEIRPPKDSMGARRRKDAETGH